MRNEPETKQRVTWHLRTPEGAVYGPARVDALRQWAEQGRIGPGCHVSADGTDWMPAEALKALDLCWQVDLGQASFYGPLNLAAVMDLFREGAIPAEAPLAHTRTGQRTTVRRKLDEASAESVSRRPAERTALQQRNRELTARVRELEEAVKAGAETAHRQHQLAREVERVRKREARLKEELAALGRRLESTTTHAAESDRNLARERARRERHELALAKREQALEETLQKLRETDRRLKDSASAHAREVDEWRQQVQQVTAERIRELEETSQLIQERLRRVKGHTAGKQPRAAAQTDAEEVAVEHIAPPAPTPTAAQSAPLARLEAQARRELEAWMTTRRRATHGMQDSEDTPDPSVPPRRIFDL